LSTNIFGFVVGVAVGCLVAWLYLLIWKVRYTTSIREDAVQRSQAITAGKVHEQLIPYLPAFPYNPKDVRFLGSPIDLVVFDGLAEGRVRRIVFLEVKTGGSSLTVRERCVRDVIQAREVEWAQLRVARHVTSGAA
jgi:predicted Holliday junction resolvase-like endonuclease